MPQFQTDAATDQAGPLTTAMLGTPLYAAMSEGADAAASSATSYTITAGDSFSGSLTGIGDKDWVRISLSAGNTYTLNLSGVGASALGDPTLRVYDASGNLVAENDDYNGSFNSRLVLSPVSSGTYYVEADSFASSFTGSYTLSTSVTAGALPVLTMTQIADYLRAGFWSDQGSVPIRFNISAGGSLDVNITGLTAAGQQLARWALDSWTAVTGIRFNYLATATGAEIVIDDWDAGAYTSHTFSGNFIVSTFVNISTAWLTNSGTSFDSYSYQTFLHELGHALGLGHAGNYNGNAIYGIDNHYLNDSWQATVMSYFSQSDNGSVLADFAYLATPMVADIIAIQAMYGITSIRGTNTTYGDNSNAGGAYNFVANGAAGGSALTNPMAFTIVDTGGRDTIDLRTRGADQRIDLTPGSYSDMNGLRGNVGIAVGTILEDVLLGAGDDRVTGNSAANLLRGGGGADTLWGGDGRDTLFGGDQGDSLRGALGNDTVSGDGGVDRIYGDGGQDSMLGGSEGDLIWGGTGADTLRGGAHGDQLFGEGDNDWLYGDGGFDTLDGGLGHDTLDGGHQADVLIGGDGNDLLIGGDGSDRLFGGNGSDTLDGGADSGNLFGEAGDDLITGGAVADLVYGGTGRDTISGGAGNDTIYGGAGFDVVTAGAGNDVLWGHANADTFVFADGFGQDRIEDFEALNAAEKIDLRAVSGIVDLADLMANHIAQVGADVLITASAADTITLVGVTLGDLDATNFLF